MTRRPATRRVTTAPRDACAHRRVAASRAARIRRRRPRRAPHHRRRRHAPLSSGGSCGSDDLIYGAQRNATRPGAVAGVGPRSTRRRRRPEPDDAARPPTRRLTADPVVLAQPADGADFGVHATSRGSAPTTPVHHRRRGHATSTLDRTIGIGHYPGTQMPGEVGNFAVAAHRTTYGARLQPHRRTAASTTRSWSRPQDGWYTYRFRTLEYVTPSAVEVLLPVPQEPDAPAGSTATSR